MGNHILALLFRHLRPRVWFAPVDNEIRPKWIDFQIAFLVPDDVFGFSASRGSVGVETRGDFGYFCIHIAGSYGVGVSRKTDGIII